MGVASGCGEQEVGVASGSGWNLWVWLLGVVVRRYIDFLILLIPTPLVSVLFCSSIPTFCSFLKCFLIILWLHTLSDVIRSLLCNQHAFSPGIIIESVDSISRDERDAPLTQYITNTGISRARYT